jgi:hypothetical protein
MTDVRYASDVAGRRAYEHYVWHSSTAAMAPKWEALSDKDRKSWCCAAQAAIDESRRQ